MAVEENGSPRSATGSTTVTAKPCASGFAQRLGRARAVAAEEEMVADHHVRDEERLRPGMSSMKACIEPRERSIEGKDDREIEAGFIEYGELHGA